jgi:phosphoglycolate phosphatase
MVQGIWEQGRGFRAVVFDLDGTLVDTIGDLTAALNRTLSDLDLPPHSESTVKDMVGGGLAKLLERGLAAHGASLTGADHDEAVARLLDHYAASPADRSRLYPGAREALSALRDAGLACGLCTNKPEPTARDLLQALGIADAFGHIQGSEAGFPKKPDPAGLAHVVRALGATPDTALMVGDSVVDVETARAAGLSGVVLVSYGYSVTPVTELKADAVINHLHELVPALALAEQAQ